jgi:hypothetical protein
MPTCDCCWCCKYAHGPVCDEWCADDFEESCGCSEADYRPLIEKRLASDD